MIASRVRLDMAAAGLGVLAAATGVAAGTAVAALTGGPSPLVAIGNAAVSLAPPALKDFAVRTLGEHDKVVLLGSAGGVLLVLAALLGVVALRRLRLGVAGVVVLGLVAFAATAVDQTTPARTWAKLLAPIVTLVVGAVSLQMLVGRMPGASSASPSGGRVARWTRARTTTSREDSTVARSCRRCSVRSR